ncbi:MAG: nitrogen regulation protein NR(I), partial [Gammaproteobacteria bacterium]|nr:nitrogen regulation protein NR(I) [Gammaproteobacteria bacterium]
DRSIRWVLEQALKRANMTTSSFEDGFDAIARLEHESPDVVITDIRMPRVDGLSVLQALHQHNKDLPVIVITAHSDLDSAVQSYKAGAFEYLPKPFDIDEAISLVQRAAASVEASVQEASSEPVQIAGMIGRDPAMQGVYRAIGRLANSSINVLITGESGSGKELVAKALHENSPRANEAFIALNISAIPADLLESELFGHEKGAFTGADARRIGRFEQANGGTLFLDEIGDMPAALQTRLLRVLAEKEFYRVGGKDPIKADVRVLAATHRDLLQRVADGTFRDDLYHRLNVIDIAVPPLRLRRSDIDLLLDHYLVEAARELQIVPKTLSANARQLLLSFDWPGNVRQLVNTCHRLSVLAPGSEIQAQDIPPELGGSRTTDSGWSEQLAAWAELHLAAGNTALFTHLLPEFERTLIMVALKAAEGRRQKAAELLGWGRNTLTRKIRELGLE